MGLPHNDQNVGSIPTLMKSRLIWPKTLIILVFAEYLRDLEGLPLEQQVVGSIPTSATKFYPCLAQAGRARRLGR